MRLTLLLLVPVTFVLTGFAPHRQIDHEDKPTNGCGLAAITLGPDDWSDQPVYAAFQDDSTEGIVHIRSDVLFQKSTDAGRTWLPADVLIRRGSPFATYPDITTDHDSNIYIVYRNQDSTGGRCYQCVRSGDGGSTWSTPVCVDSNMGSWARIAADTAGSLFVAWTAGHVYSSASTDKGMTWSPRVRVDDDTVTSECYHADVAVQPGTNHYLVVATAPYRDGSVMRRGSYLYRSADMGQTFQPGVRIDTFGGVTSQPHVVADARHVVCDYTGNSQHSEAKNTEARTLYTQPDTWSSPSLVSRLDTTQFWSYYNGAKLAISADGSVHTALMVCVDTSEGLYLPYYVSSSDHGVTWSEPELVNDDTTANSWNPDIAADSAGHAYVVWQVGSGEVWFSTNNPLAIAEETPNAELRAPNSSPTVVRDVLVLGAVESRQSTEYRAELLSVAGRKVLNLKPGANDVRALAPGIYFVRSEPSAVSRQPSAVTKIVIAR